MEMQFACTDRDGVNVYCEASCWEGHIAYKHREMVGQESAVIKAISQPLYVRRSARRPDRKLHYLPFAFPGCRGYLLAVVRYDSRKGTGHVVTAYPKGTINEADQLLWSGLAA